MTASSVALLIDHSAELLSPRGWSQGRSLNAAHWAGTDKVSAVNWVQPKSRKDDARKEFKLRLGMNHADGAPVFLT